MNKEKKKKDCKNEDHQDQWCKEHPGELNPYTNKFCTNPVMKSVKSKKEEKKKK